MTEEIPRLYTYAEAAERLHGISETWLRRHIRELPHSKFGREVRFTDADLARIPQVVHKEPEVGPLAAEVSKARARNVTPLPRRKRATA